MTALTPLIFPRRALGPRYRCSVDIRKVYRRKEVSLLLGLRYNILDSAGFAQFHIGASSILKRGRRAYFTYG